MMMLLFNQYFANVGIAPLPENMDLANIALATSLLFLPTHAPTFPCAYLLNTYVALTLIDENNANVSIAH
jgi:hypothetical protein